MLRHLFYPVLPEDRGSFPATLDGDSVVDTLRQWGFGGPRDLDGIMALVMPRPFLEIIARGSFASIMLLGRFLFCWVVCPTKMSRRQLVCGKIRSSTAWPDVRSTADINPKSADRETNDVTGDGRK